MSTVPVFGLCWHISEGLVPLCLSGPNSQVLFICQSSLTHCSTSILFFNIWLHISDEPWSGVLNVIWVCLFVSEVQIHFFWGKL
jgi:hypothetical protein